ncbi:kinase-like protein [Mycena galericulata]|nr:kinase-like protein [Mycena galericulata]
MKPGDIVGARYEVVRKLGWGEYSTVWQVKPQASEIYAAMKVMKAEVTDLPELHESEYLRRVLTADPTHPGFRHNLHLLDEFRLQGPNGRHLCLVTELLGERLDQYAKRFPHGRVPMAMIKMLSRQIINAILYLHEKCDIIHTDIKGNNVLFTLPALSTAPIADQTSPPTAVKLIDLGVACWADRVFTYRTAFNPFTDIIQSPELRAPEVVVGACWGKPADIWSLGCLVFELATGTFLIQDSVAEMSVPYLHAVFFGPYPRTLTEFGKNKYSDMFFKEDGSPRYSQTERMPVAEMIRRRRPPGDQDTHEDIEGLISFLDLMFRLDPAERASLRNLLDHPWLSSK